MDVTNRHPASVSEELKELQNRAEALRRTIFKIESFEGDLSGSLWQELKQRLKAMVDVVNNDQNALDQPSGAQAPDRFYWYGMGKKSAAVSILYLEDLSGQKEKFEKQLKETQDKIESIKRTNARNGSK